MLRFFARTPGLGVEITSSAVRVALTSGRGTNLSVLHAGTLDLPAGVVTESYSSTNIHDPGGLASALRSCLADAPAQADRVALSLPDDVFRVQTLEFDELPAKSMDRERLIRWRLEKAAAFDISDTVLRYQMLHQRERGFTVLACLVKQPVLEQYENVVSLLGMETWIVGLSSFHTLNFFLPLIAKHSAISALAYITDNFFTTIVTEAGGASFYRYKEVKRGGEIRPRLMREIEDSLHFYTHRDRSQTSKVERLYLAGDSEATLGLADELRTTMTLDVEVLSPTAVLAELRESASSVWPVSMAAALGAGSSL
jgi:Tfp pilus assembly PilM family ATPase